MTFASALKGLLGVREANAHCDIPCGIYDPNRGKDRRADGTEDGSPHRAARG